MKHYYKLNIDDYCFICTANLSAFFGGPYGLDAAGIHWSLGMKLGEGNALIKYFHSKPLDELKKDPHYQTNLKLFRNTVNVMFT